MLLGEFITDPKRKFQLLSQASACFRNSAWQKVEKKIKRSLQQADDLLLPQQTVVSVFDPEIENTHEIKSQTEVPIRKEHVDEMRVDIEDDEDEDYVEGDQSENDSNNDNDNNNDNDIEMT